MDEQAFLDAIAANPTDVTHRLIFADWLEEQGDPRCEAVRHQCRFRMPFTRDELRRFEKVQLAREQANGSLVEMDMDLNSWNESAHFYWDPVIDVARVQAEEVIENLDSNRLARYFPWDDGGRLPLKAIVRLTHILEGDNPDFYQLAIVAAGPTRRSDPQRITVTIMSLRNRIITDDWRRERWRWDRRVPLEDELAAAGYDREAVAMARFDRGPQLLGPLWRKAQEGLEEREKIALATLLLDAGRFEDALEFCGVGFVPELSQRLDGMATWTLEPQQQIDRVGRALRRHLWESAPWRFARCLDEYDWPYERPFERPGGTSNLPVKLFPLPGQANKSKVWLALCRAESGQPILDFVDTTATDKAPRHLWKRPVEFDIARLSLES